MKILKFSQIAILALYIYPLGARLQVCLMFVYHPHNMYSSTSLLHLGLSNPKLHACHLFI